MNYLEKLSEQLEKALPLLEEINRKFAREERFVRAGDAAQILGVSKSVIDRCANVGLLKPYYVNSEQRRYKLSDVYNLAKDSPWSTEDAGDVQNIKK